ncbi:uncharacterized protein LOC135830698 [Sycon ciliatum]|uniref:uncharacterized protein LOC135830698 n=1 Tax=Sycon ciliatum TaxID=27933 RepID=UPI0031F64D93
MEDACSVSLLQTTKSRTLETQLAGQLTSLSDASATGAHLTRTRKAPAAVRTGQDVHYFRRLREQHFMELLEVPEMPHWSTLRDTMQQEEAACLQSDFSPETLPLILHQFFVDRIASLVRLRLMYMQRWSKQQNVNSLGTTALYERYKQHLSMVMTEYDDCVQRAERLASAHDACLAGKPVRLGLVKDEDVNIYLRHLVLTEQSWRDPSAFLAQLKWLPHSNLHVLHQLLPVMDVSAWENEADARNELTKLRAMAPRANVQWKIAFQKRRATVPNLTDVANSTSKPKLPLPLLSKVLQRPKSETIQQESIAEVGDKPYCLSSPLEEYNDYGDVTPHVHCERAYRAVLARLLTTYGLQSSWNYEKKSDQLEMFKLVSDKFKTTMERQGKQMTFKVYLFPEHLEDKKPADAGKTPRTSCNRVWLKEANWQDESKLAPYVDPVQEEVVSQLRNNTKIDELLRLSMDACQLHHAEKVIYSLKRHVATSRKPPPLSSLSRPSTTQYRSTKRDDHVPALTQMWEQILKGVDPFDPSFRINGGKSRAGSGRPRNLPDDAKQVDHGAEGVDPFAKIQTSSFDFNSASRVLAEQQESLFGSHQQQSEELLDSFTAFTMLRHLRIRDLRRTALSIFNYFRSVERSLVIGLTGLAKGKQPGKAGTTQAYVFEKPSDYQISAQEFMEIQEVSNHDDRHVVEGGRVQVKDQWKYHVVYDVAVDDLKKLEDYLVLVGSYYLVKHHSSAAATADDARRFAFLPEESDMASLSGQAVDRFAVLLDLWNCHVRFMERKHALLDCYLEAYHNVYDQQEKERLAQVIVDIIYQQPRHVLEANWFLRCYKTEIECLELHREIAHTLLTSQISAQRMFFTGLFPSGSSPNMVGVPLPTLSKCPISLSTSSALGQVFLLEFHPSLCVASRLPAALRHAANWTFFQMGKVGTHNVLRSCHATFQLAVRKLGESNSLIQAYSSEVRQALFQNPLMENPLFVTSLIPQQKKVAVKAVGGDSSDPAELKKAVASAYCDVLHFVSSYHRLADACLESSQLLKGYHLLSDPLGFGQMHAFMRMASIDVAASNPGTILKPLFLTSITTEGKDMFDQYIPVSVPLAAHEIDDKVFALQLSTKEDVIKMLSASSLETFRAILYAQVAQKNALIIGVLHTRACCQIHKTSASLEHVEAAVDSGSSLAALTSGKPRVSSAQLVIGLDLVQKLTDMFVSLQLHKAASRDMVLHELLTQPGISSKLQSPQENVKVKRVTLVQYFEKLGSLLAPQALRIQLSSCMFSLHQLLRDFPGTRDAVFEIGQDTDYKSGTGKRPQSATTAESGEQTPSHGIPVFEPSFRAGRSRARAFMTVDGKHLMNLFFLPHPLEALAMFRSLDLDEAMPALNSALRLLTCLHDICSIICARAKLNCPILQASGGSGGSGGGRVRRRQDSPPILNAYSTGLSADWGGLERITSELQELRKAIQKLECPTDPVQVAEYLESVREVRYRQLLVVVRDILPTTFLDMGDEQGAQIVQAKSRQCLDIIANVSRYSACQFHWNGRPVPQPLHVMKKKAARLMPLAKFTSDRGPYPHCLSPPTELSKQCIAMFCCLHNEQLNITHGVLCEMTLLQNEACQDATAAAAAAAEQSLADSSADQAGHPCCCPLRRRSKHPPHLSRNLHHPCPGRLQLTRSLRARRFASHHLRWIARLSWHSCHCPVAWVSFGRSGSYSRAGPKPWSRAVSTVPSNESVSSSPERSASPEIGDAADDVEGMESTEAAATGGTEDTSAGDEAMSLKSHVEAVEVLAAGDDGSEGGLT